MVTELTLTEQSELERHEAVIERGLKTFVDVGQALAEIRDKRLYRQQHGTFEEYCQEKWGLERRRAYQLMDAATVAGNVKIFSHPPQVESHAAPLAKLEPEQQAEAWQRAVETAPNGKVTGAHVAQVVQEFTNGKPASHQLINQSTNNEWYTPAPYVDAARTVMGGIDLDPASNSYANQTVKAVAFYAEEQDGFNKRWYGRVWLNPPYGFRDDSGQSNQALWSKRLIDEYYAGNVDQAVLLVNAVPGNRWFRPLWDFPICFPDHRIRFYNEDTEAGQPTHSNALVYMGANVQKFAETFSAFGVVAVRYEL